MQRTLKSEEKSPLFFVFSHQIEIGVAFGTETPMPDGVKTYLVFSFKAIPADSVPPKPLRKRATRPLTQLRCDPVRAGMEIPHQDSRTRMARLVLEFGNGESALSHSAQSFVAQVMNM